MIACHGAFFPTTLWRPPEMSNNSKRDTDFFSKRTFHGSSHWSGGRSKAADDRGAAANKSTNVAAKMCCATTAIKPVQQAHAARAAERMMARALAGRARASNRQRIAAGSGCGRRPATPRCQTQYSGVDAIVPTSGSNTNFHMPVVLPCGGGVQLAVTTELVSRDARRSAAS